MAAPKSPYRRPHRKIKSAEKHQRADSILTMLVKTNDKPAADKPKAKRVIPKPPAGILDAIGTAEWKRVCELMLDEGTLNGLDTTTLVLHCDAWSDFVKAVRELKKTKAVETGKKNGGQFRNPWFDIKKRAAQEMNTYSVILGFSARDRKQKGQQPSAPANPFDGI